MILRQFLHSEPTAASYLLGCVGKAASVVVDPLFPIKPYMDAAADAGTPIRLVIDTHIHADHRSAGRALAQATGAEYAAGAAAETADMPPYPPDTAEGLCALSLPKPPAKPLPFMPIFCCWRRCICSSFSRRLAFSLASFSLF